MADVHDQLMTALIRAFPADFLTLTAPELARRVELGDVRFRREELAVDGPKGRTPRRPDLVAKVRLRSPPAPAGRGEQAMIHVEVELKYQSATPARLDEYNWTLNRHAKLPVHTIVMYLHGGPAGVQRQVYRQVSAGLEIRTFQYQSLGLSQASAAELLARPEPLAWALAILASRKSVGTRAELGVACLRRIAEARELDDKQRRRLVNCVATYVESDPEASEELEALLRAQTNQEVQAMMMTWEDKHVARGRQQERQENLKGMRDLVLRQLTQRFGRLSATVEERVSAISSAEELRQIAGRILEVDSLEALGLA